MLTINREPQACLQHKMPSFSESLTRGPFYSPDEKEVDDFLTNILLTDHEKQLRKCGTKWVINGIFLRERKTENGIDHTIVGPHMTQNSCNNKDCPICSGHRVITIKKKLHKYFQAAYKVDLVSLTYPNVKDLNTETVKEAFNLISNYMTLQRRRYKINFYGFRVIEFKYQNNTKTWNIHFHLYYFNNTPSVQRIRYLWDTVTSGLRQENQHFQTNINYTFKLGKKDKLSRRIHDLCYLAKRSANTGLWWEESAEDEIDEFYDNGKGTIVRLKELLMPIPEDIYMTFIYGRKTYHRFGKFPKDFAQGKAYFSSTLLASTLIETMRKNGYIYVKMFVGTILKTQIEEKPPDDGYGMLARMAEEDDRFIIDKKGYIHLGPQHEYGHYIINIGLEAYADPVNDVVVKREVIVPDRDIRDYIDYDHKEGVV